MIRRGVKETKHVDYVMIKGKGNTVVDKKEKDPMKNTVAG